MNITPVIPKENRQRQMEEEPCPFPHHERIDKIDDACKHHQPSEKQHRGYRGGHGPNHSRDAEQHQHDAKRQKPSPVVNHLLGNLHYHHIDP